MALITRVTRLFTADFNAVLDRIEEPLILLQQSIREMEADLAADEQRVKWLKLEQKQVSQREAELNKVMAGLEEELDICLDADNEKLARTTLRRKLECERRFNSLKQQQQQDNAELATLEEQLIENRQVLENYRQKAEVFATTEGDYLVSDSTIVADTITEDEIEIALLKEMQRRETRGAA